MKYTFVVIKNKLIKMLVLILYILLLMYLIVFSKENYLLSKEVVQFWVNVLIPSLLPFLLFSEVILNTQVSHYFNRAFGYITSKLFRLPENSSICIILRFSLWLS